MQNIDLNCDMGESFGAYVLGNDAAILPYVSSVNVACGFHAGDPGVMRRTVEAAARHGVAIGAHPGFPDLQGFGRRAIQCTAEEVYDMCVYQIGALAAVCRAAGTRLTHVKPHGALYNLAAKDAALAGAIARAVRDLDAGLWLYGLSGSLLVSEAEALGLRAAAEAFADRTYRADGSLTPRSEPNALIEREADALRQVLQLVRDGTVTAVTGEIVPVRADTICIHGDGAHAVDFARAVAAWLKDHGVSVRAVSGER